MQGFEHLSDYLGLGPLEIIPIKGGYSNLTYLVKGQGFSYILRQPPRGLAIAKAHDMVREFKVLQALQAAGYQKMPKPFRVCADESVIGAPFFLMEAIEGQVLRQVPPPGADAAYFNALSHQALEVLLELHALELEQSGLAALGKAEGYVERQVLGWAARYEKAQTEKQEALEKAFAWLPNHWPKNPRTAFIHNDFKYDNLMLSDQGQVLAVLDWEMATIGDPLMDLGTTLAYWAEAEDSDLLKSFNLSYLPGNFSRAEVMAYYQEQSGLSMEDMPFYYAFGLCKIACIAQQIYQRYSMGFAQDQRFATLNLVVKSAGEKAWNCINTGKI